MKDKNITDAELVVRIQKAKGKRLTLEQKIKFIDFYIPKTKNICRK